MTDRAEGHDIVTLVEEFARLHPRAWQEAHDELHRGIVERLRATIAAQDTELQRLRDRWVPCEPCQQGRHDDCTGDCTSNCCALAYSEERVDELEKAARDVVEASDEWVTQRVEDPRGLSEAEGATVAALRDLHRDLDGVGT